MCVGVWVCGTQFLNLSPYSFALISAAEEKGLWTGEIIVYEYVYEYGGGLQSVLVHVLLHANPISTLDSRLSIFASARVIPAITRVEIRALCARFYPCIIFINA